MYTHYSIKKNIYILSNTIEFNMWLCAKTIPLFMKFTLLHFKSCAYYVF